MRNCFVPNCDHYCKTHQIQKRMMFVSPKNKEIFDEWKSRLFNRRPFRSMDRICERHFTKDQILTHWDHIIDGKLVQLEREKPRLKDNAIPQLNLEYRHPHTKRNRIQVPKRQKVACIGTQISTEEADTAADDEMDMSNDVDHDADHLEMPRSDEKVVDVQIEKLTATDSDATTAAETRIETDDATTKRKIFETIYDDIYEVMLPNTLWSIHRDPDQSFIAFTQFDVVKMNCNKSLCVWNTFDIRATISGADVINEKVNVLSIEFLSEALSELDERQNDYTSPE